MRVCSAVLFRGLLFWAASGAGLYTLASEEGVAPPRQVLYLTTEFSDDLSPTRRTNLLGREILRQAVLIAARDELGVATYDQTLGEEPPDGVEVVRVYLREQANSRGTWRVRLYGTRPKSERRDRKPFFDQRYQFPMERDKIYAGLVPLMEEASRGELAKALEEGGLQKQEAVAPEGEAAAGRLEEALLEVDFIAQFGVVRAAHELAARKETAEALGLLARGYANLGLLTRHQFNAVGDAFTARSWLYAQRQMALHGDNAETRRVRAYAWALGGTLHHGLADLAESDRKNNPGSDPPGWLALVEPYCKTDRAATRQAGALEPSLEPLAVRLWFDLTSAYQIDEWTYSSGQEAIELLPTGYGVYAEMALSGGGLGRIRTGAFGAPLAFARHAMSSLQALPGLPEGVKAVTLEGPEAANEGLGFGAWFSPESPFSEQPNEAAAALEEASARSVSPGLSWSALSYLLKEEQFLQVANYLEISTNSAEYSLEDVVEAVLPLVEGHRYEAYIESFYYNLWTGSLDIEDLAEDMRIWDPRGNMRRMCRRLWIVDERSGRGLGERASRNRARNFTFRGMLEHYFPTSSRWKETSTSISPANVAVFRSIAPHSDIGVRFAVYASRKPNVEKVRRWEGQLKEDPTAFLNLAQHYRSFEENDADAARCLKRSLELLPTLAASEALSRIYWKKDFDAWLDSFQPLLESPSSGLSQGRAHDWLAYGYAYYGLWEQAHKHGEQAGATGAAWGMHAAADTSEALARWEESESWARQMSEAYPSASGYQWYMWCRRTGRGDLKGARKLAEQYFATEKAKPSQTFWISLGVYHLLEGDRESALDAYRRAHASGPTFTVTFMIAQLAKELGDEALRSEVLEEMAALSEERRDTEEFDKHKDIYAAGLAITAFLQSGEITDGTMEQIDTAMALVGDRVVSSFGYIVGKELIELGDVEAGEAYLRRSLVLPYREPWYSTLSGSLLAVRHGTSRPDDAVLTEADLWPERTDPGRPRAD
ncbi:MAG: hypothetical protein AAGA92_14165 [Planctomycetota bacterium]